MGVQTKPRSSLQHTSSPFELVHHGRRNGIFRPFFSALIKLRCVVTESPLLLLDMGHACHVNTTSPYRDSWIICHESNILLDTDTAVHIIRSGYAGVVGRFKDSERTADCGERSFLDWTEWIDESTCCDSNPGHSAVHLRTTIDSQSPSIRYRNDITHAMEHCKRYSLHLSHPRSHHIRPPSKRATQPTSLQNPLSLPQRQPQIP